MASNARRRLGLSATALAAALALTLCFASGARAVDLDENIQVHGFGSWHYGRTVATSAPFTGPTLPTTGYPTGTFPYPSPDGITPLCASPTTGPPNGSPLGFCWAPGAASSNQPYLGGTKEGRWNNVHAALNIGATPMEGLFISTQFSLGVEEDGEIETDLDYAFGEWTFSNLLKLRAGRIKQPFGIYTEIFEVGTLRPFISLPQSIYGPVGIVAEGYDGAGLTGTYGMDDWSIRYDVYGGQLFAKLHALVALPEGSIKTPDMFGGRIGVETPLDGLSFGASGYFGPNSLTEVPGITATRSNGRRFAVGAHGEYLSEAWLFRAEYTHSSVQAQSNTDSAYAEIAYKFYGGWQIAYRIDWANLDLLDPTLKASIPSGGADHKDYTGGINYWFSPNFVVKTAYHYIQGNRFSQPETLLLDFKTPYAMTGQAAPDDTNHLFEAGAQFSF